MTIELVLGIIKDYGPQAIFLVLWWLERGEKIDAQKELSQVAKESAVAIATMQLTIDRVTRLFDRFLGRRNDQAD